MCPVTMDEALAVVNDYSALVMTPQLTVGYEGSEFTQKEKG